MSGISSLFPSTNAQWAENGQRPSSTDITYSYYPFLSINNLHNLLPQDVNYLESQGCLRVPTPEILDEFVRQYFLHVHPLMPVINEGDFWEMYGQFGFGGSGERMSLLVFQSMLFVACNFVSKEKVKSLGFPSTRVARATLYRRCKLLYDFESESSMIYLSPNGYNADSVVAQLHTSFQEVQLNMVECRHPACEKCRGSPLLGTPDFLSNHKSLAIQKAKRAQAPLVVFSSPAFGYRDMADEVERSHVYDPATKKCLVEMFVQIVELCSVLTDLIMMVFPLDDSPGWGKKIGPDETVKVRECKQALRRWYSSTTQKFPMFGGCSSPRTNVTRGKGHHHDSVILYTNMMYMYYHSSWVALSHHEILQTAVTAVTPNLTSNLREFSSIYENRHELQNAASGVTECLQELIQLKLARWLPISAVPCTALPLVLHIIDVKLSSFRQNKTSPEELVKQNRLNVLVEAMKTYTPQYDGCDYVSETIRHIMTLAQLDTPTPLPAASTTSTISNWTDILASQPGCYLRLAMTMDLSFAKGRLPEESDFPASLRGLFTAGRNPVRALLRGSPRMRPSTIPSFMSTSHHQMFSPPNSYAMPGSEHRQQQQHQQHSSPAPTFVPLRAGHNEDGSIGNQVSTAHINGTVCGGDLVRPYHESMMMLDNFTASDFEVGDIAGEILAAQFLRQSNDYGPAAAVAAATAASAAMRGSSAEETDHDDQRTEFHNGQRTGFHDGGEEAIMGGMETWFDNAWATEADAGGHEDGDAARVLRDAMSDGGVECGA
ncbi:fungal specific transcription factor domain-containing protein [Apiospora arundinis]